MKKKTKERVTDDKSVYFGYFYNKKDDMPLFGKAYNLIRNSEDPKTVIYTDHILDLKKIKFYQELLIEVEK